MRTDDDRLAAALDRLGSADGDLGEGLVLAPRDGLETWDDVEAELAEVFELTRAAAVAGAPVVYVLRTDSLLGRRDPRSCAVAAGLLSGVRALAFERRAEARTATAIAYGADVRPDEVAGAVAWILSTPGVNGQVIALGNEHFGALLP